MEFGVVGLDNHHHHHHHLHHNHHLNSHNININNHLHHHGLSVSSSTTNGISSPPSSDPETNKLHRATPYGSDAPGLLSGSAVKQERSAADSALDDYWRSSKVAKTGRDDRDDDRRRHGDRDDDDNIDKRVVFEQRSGGNTSGTGTVTRASTGATTTLSFLDSNGSYSQPPPQPQHQMLSFSTKSEAHDTFSYFPSSVSAYTTRNSNNNTGYNHGGGIMRSSPLSSPIGGGFTASQWMELEHQALIYKYITTNVPIPSHLLTPFRNSTAAVAFSSFPAAVLRSNPLGGGWGAFHLGFSNNADPEPGRCRRTDGKKWRCSRDAVADQKYCERHMNRGRQRSRKPVEGHVAANNNNNNSNNKSSLPATRHHLDINSSSNRNVSGGTLSLLKSSSKETTSTPLFPQKQQQQQIPYVDTSSSPPLPPSTEFGLVTSVDSLLKPPQQPQQSSFSLHHFIDDWPNMDPRTTTRTAATTQLSISIPTATSVSPLRLSNNWGPVSWEAAAAGSLGGPLGEALNQPPNSNHSGGNDSKSLGSSVLNLMPEIGGWEGSSPTGVLQKTAFGSLSNSSAGSSPTRAHDLLGGSSSSSLPAAL